MHTQLHVCAVHIEITSTSFESLLHVSVLNFFTLPCQNIRSFLKVRANVLTGRSPVSILSFSKPSSFNLNLDCINQGNEREVKHF